MNHFFIRAGITAALMVSQTSYAVESVEQRAFDLPPVSESLLAEVRGGHAPFMRLTASTFARMIDDERRSAFQQMGEVGRIQMDVWWGSIGNELVAQSVRGTGGR